MRSGSAGSVGTMRDLGAPPPAVAPDVGAGSNEEPVEPGVEPLDVAQRGQIAPGPDQCVLSGILREFGIAQDEASGRVQPIDGADGQHTEGLAVSVSRPFDELRLHASLPSEATDLVTYTLRRSARGSGSNFDDDPSSQIAPGEAGAQQAQPPSADPRTASAAAQHGPESVKTWSVRRGRSRCRSSPARRESRAWSPAIRSAISARRSTMRRGSSAVVSAQCPAWHQLGDAAGILERHAKPTQVDQEPQMLDIGLAVVTVGVVTSGR